MALKCQGLGSYKFRFFISKVGSSHHLKAIANQRDGRKEVTKFSKNYRVGGHSLRPWHQPCTSHQDYLSYKLVTLKDQPCIVNKFG